MLHVCKTNFLPQSQDAFYVSPTLNQWSIYSYYPKVLINSCIISLFTGLPFGAYVNF